MVCWAFPGPAGFSECPWERGPDTQDLWGKVQAERFEVLFFPQTQLKSGDVFRESCGPTHLVLQQLSRDSQVPSKG